jgi:hypothetical protein
MHQCHHFYKIASLEIKGIFLLIYRPDLNLNDRILANFKSNSCHTFLKQGHSDYYVIHFATGWPTMIYDDAL